MGEKRGRMALLGRAVTLDGPGRARVSSKSAATLRMVPGWPWKSARVSLCMPRSARQSGCLRLSLFASIVYRCLCACKAACGRARVNSLSLSVSCPHASPSSSHARVSALDPHPPFMVPRASRPCSYGPSHSTRMHTPRRRTPARPYKRSTPARAPAPLPAERPSACMRARAPLPAQPPRPSRTRGGPGGPAVAVCAGAVEGGAAVEAAAAHVDAERVAVGVEHVRVVAQLRVPHKGVHVPCPVPSRPLLVPCPVPSRPLLVPCPVPSRPPPLCVPAHPSARPAPRHRPQVRLRARSRTPRPRARGRHVGSTPRPRARPRLGAPGMVGAARANRAMPSLPR